MGNIFPFFRRGREEEAGRNANNRYEREIEINPVNHYENSNGFSAAATRAPTPSRNRRRVRGYSRGLSNGRSLVTPLNSFTSQPHENESPRDNDWGDLATIISHSDATNAVRSVRVRAVQTSPEPSTRSSSSCAIAGPSGTPKKGRGKKSARIKEMLKKSRAIKKSAKSAIASKKRKSKNKNPATTSSRKVSSTVTSKSSSSPIQSASLTTANNSDLTIKRWKQSIAFDKFINKVTDKDGGLKYECKKCTKKFISKSHRIYHYFCAYPQHPRPYNCKRCGQGFISKAHYQYHMKRSHSTGPHICRKCGKTFQDRSKLIRHHQLIHENNNFTCNQCKKGLATKDSLKRHMKIHQKQQKSHTCSICNMVFTRLSSYTAHLKSHESEAVGRHCCHICDQSFASEDSLNQHGMNHNEESGRQGPHQCDVCEKQFKNLKDLRAHEIIHSDGNFTCPRCSLNFTRYHNMIRHINNIHGRRGRQGINAIEPSK